LAKHSVLLAVLATGLLGCPPPTIAVLPLVRPAVVFEGERADVELPDAFDVCAVGASGRFMVFHLKQRQQVVVLDVAKAKIVHTIPGVAEGVLLAAGADKLLLVRPGGRLIERWDLWSLRREQVAAVPTREPPGLAAMGCAGDGPLLLGTQSEAMLVDVATLRPMAVEGKVIGARGRYGYVLDVSADGRTFAGIVAGVGPVAYNLMALEGRRLRAGSFSSTSHANRWARPSGDGSVLCLPGGGLYASNLARLSAKWLEGASCFPTPDPAFFIAVRFVPDEKQHATEARICTTGDRRVVHTILGLDEMAPRGNTSSRHSIARRLADHQPRFFYFPAVQALVTLPYDDRRVIIRRLDVLGELEATGAGYLFVTSVPPTFATKGERLSYRIAAQSSAGGIRCTLEDGPAGARVSRNGTVTWDAPSESEDDWATLVISVRDRAGQEAFHTIHLRLLDPPQAAESGP